MFPYKILPSNKNPYKKLSSIIVTVLKNLSKLPSIPKNLFNLPSVQSSVVLFSGNLSDYILWRLMSYRFFKSIKRLTKNFIYKRLIDLKANIAIY